MAHDQAGQLNKGEAYMANIEWETPPPSKRGRRSPVLEAFRAELRNRPGEWGVLRDRGTSSAQAMTKHHRGFEAVTRIRAVGGEKVYDLYARYVGEADQ